MGLYLRKSVNVGPFRFNLSKAGIGISAGIPGFRIGMGPRGNYVHMGAGGIYYRATISQQPSPSGDRTGQQKPDRQQTEVRHDGFVQIDSKDISELRDIEAKDLLDEIDRKRKMVPIWKTFGTAALISFFGSIFFMDDHRISFYILLAGIVLTPLLSIFDAIRKTTVIFYDLENEAERKYESLIAAFISLKNAQKLWHIEAKADVSNINEIKKNAGATSLIKRNEISIKEKLPPYIKANINVPAVPCGNETLYFFPDKVLVFTPKGVGAISYKNLKVETQSRRFIEEESLPRDANVVGKTWRYVNKSGGPDKRFKNNRELPIAQYQQIDFTSQSGLNERIHSSKYGSADSLAGAVATLAN